MPHPHLRNNQNFPAYQISFFFLAFGLVPFALGLVPLTLGLSLRSLLFFFRYLPRKLIGGSSLISFIYLFNILSYVYHQILGKRPPTPI